MVNVTDKHNVTIWRCISKKLPSVNLELLDRVNIRRIRLVTCASCSGNKMRDQANKKKPPRTFYYYFRPIALIGRSFGVFPLTDLHRSSSDTLKFSFCSVPVFFTILVFVVFSGLMVYFIVWSIAMLKSSVQVQHSTFMWLITLEIITIMYSFASCFFCTWNGKNFVKLIKLLDFFDKQKQSQKKCPNEFVTILKYIVRPLLLGGSELSLMIFGLVTFSRSTLETGEISNFSKFSYFFFGIMAIWQVAPILYYLYFASTITENFRFINKRCSELIPLTKWYVQPATDVHLANIRDALRNIRYLHVLMRDAVKYLSLSYGFFLAIGQLYTILTFVIGFYLAFFTSTRSTNLFFYVSVYCFLSVVVVIISHKTFEEVRLSFYLFL